tara:strand:+ start:495 stop:701 length:207 start_codon:yes stop_codon:yes gene_type:complete
MIKEFEINDILVSVNSISKIKRSKNTISTINDILNAVNNISKIRMKKDNIKRIKSNSFDKNDNLTITE